MENMYSIKGRAALITGAGSGIGRAVAIEFARQGAKLGLLSRGKEETQDIAEQVRRLGSEAICLPADVSKPQLVEEAVEKMFSAFGRLDIVFANAGVNGVWASVETLTPEEFSKTLDINLNGTFYTIKYAVPHLKKQGGSVIITSSVNGTRMFSNTGSTAYACSKGAQTVLAKMLALELAPAKIRVNVVCPGAISTQIEENMEVRDLDDAGEMVKYPRGKVPLTDGKPGSSAQVARLVLFLASDASDHISGTELWIDGAQSLLQG